MYLALELTLINQQRNLLWFEDALAMITKAIVTLKGSKNQRIKGPKTIIKLYNQGMKAYKSQPRNKMRWDTEILIMRGALERKRSERHADHVLIMK